HRQHHRQRRTALTRPAAELTLRRARLRSALPETICRSQRINACGRSRDQSRASNHQGGTMTVLYEKDETATFDGTTETTMTPAPGVPPRGVRIDVNELSRVVRVRNRGELTLLDAVSFTLSAGELVAIVGPSGAGKTTLLEAI